MIRSALFLLSIALTVWAAGPVVVAGPAYTFDEHTAVRLTVDGTTVAEPLPALTAYQHLYAPALAVARHLGLGLRFNAQKGTLIFEGDMGRVELASVELMQHDGQVSSAHAAVGVVEGRTGRDQAPPVLWRAAGPYVSLRHVGESLGWHVAWDAEEGTVRVWTAAPSRLWTTAVPLAFIVPGLRVGQQLRGTPVGPVLVQYVDVDPSYGLRLRPVAGRRNVDGWNGRDDEQGLETVSSIARRTGALAAVNGTYFDRTGSPLGLLVVDGQWLAQPVYERTAVGWNDEGRWVMGRVGFWGELLHKDGRVPVHGYNRPRGPGEVVVYTPGFGRSRTPNRDGWEWVVRDGRVVAVSAAGVAIPPDGWVVSAEGPVVEALITVKVGDWLHGRWGLKPDWLAEGITFAVGAGPRLLSDGRVHITAEEERFRPDVAQGRAPRSAIGITADGRVLLVAVTGRQPGLSVGVTLEELAEIMRELGAVEAMNLDGGGSTTLVVGGRVLNAPSDGSERPVGNALVVLAPDSGGASAAAFGPAER